MQNRVFTCYYWVMTKTDAEITVAILHEAGFTDAEAYQPDPRWSPREWLVADLDTVIDSIDAAEEIVAQWEL